MRIVSPKQYRRMLRPAHTWEEYKRGKGYLSKCMKYHEKQNEKYKKIWIDTANYVWVWAWFDIFVQK